MPFGVGNFLLQEMCNFVAPGQDSSPIYRVSPKYLTEGEGQSIPGGGKKQDLRRDIFGKIGDIRDYNSGR